MAAAACYRIRSAQGGEAAVELVDWKRQIEEHWSRLRFGRVQVATHDNLYHFEIQIWLDDLDPDSVRVELIADPGPGLPAMREVMARVSRLEGGGYSYTGRVPANRPVGDDTPRAVPYTDGVSVPLEAAEISWQR